MGVSHEMSRHLLPETLTGTMLWNHFFVGRVSLFKNTHGSIVLMISVKPIDFDSFPNNHFDFPGTLIILIKIIIKIIC